MIVDFLTCLWKYAKEKITEEIGSVADLGASRCPRLTGWRGREADETVGLRGCRCNDDRACCLGCGWVCDHEGCGDQGWLGPELEGWGQELAGSTPHHHVSL